jgi:hypothetical protein
VSVPVQHRVIEEEPGGHALKSRRSYDFRIGLPSDTPLRRLPVLWGLLPIGIAAAWIPARSHAPNTDVALLLVLCVAAAAALGGRQASLVGAVASATAFDLFDSPPYGQLAMTRGRDVATALVLVAAGVVVGELSVRLTNYRAMAVRRGEDLTALSGAAQLLAYGEDASTVVPALARELVARLDLGDCWFEAGPLSGERPYVDRDGTLVGIAGRPPDTRIVELDLPVWTGQQVVGCYRMTLVSATRPDRDRLVAAVRIAEQAGAAFAASRPDGPDTPPRPRRLRLVR